MIYELRQYTLAPGTQDDYLRNNEAIGRKIRGDAYGKLEGYWTTELGTLNRLVHLWEYEDLNQREALRIDLTRNVAWNRDYIPKIQLNLTAQKYDFLYPIVPLTPPAEGGNVYELRWYYTHPGTANAFIELMKGIAPVYQRYAHQVGLMRTEPSRLSEIVQLVAHRSLDERAAKLAQLEQNGEWQEFLKKSQPLLSRVTASVLRSVPFSPMQ